MDTLLVSDDVDTSGTAPRSDQGSVYDIKVSLINRKCVNYGSHSVCREQTMTDAGL